MKNKILVLALLALLFTPALSYAQDEFDDYEEKTSFGEQVKHLLCHVLKPFTSKNSHLGRPYRITLRKYIKTVATTITAPRPQKPIAPITRAKETTSKTLVKKLSTENERIVRLIENADIKRSGVLRLSEMNTGISLNCPERVKAGSPIAIKIIGTGDLDEEWEFGILERGGVVCAIQKVKLGRKAESDNTQKKTVSFPTYRGEVGKLMGIRVRKIGRLDAEHIFWVELIK